MIVKILINIHINRLSKDTMAVIRRKKTGIIEGNFAEFSAYGTGKVCAYNYLTINIRGFS